MTHLLLYILHDLLPQLLLPVGHRGRVTWGCTGSEAVGRMGIGLNLVHLERKRLLLDILEFQGSIAPQL